MLLLSGLSPEEALKLRWSDVDRSSGEVRVSGGSTRTIRLNPLHVRKLASESASADAPVLRDAAGQAAALESLSTQLLCAAHDAGLDRVEEVTPQALQHVYVSFLVRQGIRFSDLTQFVGPLPGATLVAYSAMAPEGTRISREAVDHVFPGLDGLEAERTSPESRTI